MSTAVPVRAASSDAPPPAPVPAGGGNALRRVSLRGLMAHRMRFVLTLLAVMLGTAFVSGSFVLTHSLGSSVDALVGGVVQNTDVVVQAPANSSKGLPLSLSHRLRGVSDVAGVEPSLGGGVTLVGSNGKAVPATGAPVQGLAWSEGADNASAVFHLIDGRAPAAAGEVAINDQGLKRSGLKVGDTTRVGLPLRGLVKVKVVGAYRFDFTTGGYVGVAFTPARARAEFAPGRTTNQFYVRGSEGISQERLRDEVSRVTPAGATVQTQRTYLDDASRRIDSGLSFLNVFLLIFGLLGLVVGASLIYITFSMVVAQRLRELALLRAIGATRGQITRSVLAESVVVGLVGAALGVLLGWVLGLALLRVLGHFYGVPLGSATLPVPGALASLGLGTAVTVVSAVIPAIQAGATPPVEAMGAHGATPRVGRVRVLGAIVTTVLAALLTVRGVATGSLPLLGIGAFLALADILVVSPLLAPAVMALFRPLTRWTPVGRLAHGNTIRNPRRTAATAAALALGLALISTAAMLASSSKATLTDTYTQGQRWDLVVNSGQQRQPLPTYVVRGMQRRAASGSTMGLSGVRLPTKKGDGVDALSVSGDFPAAMAPPMVSGNATLRRNTMLVSERAADSHGWKVGTRVALGGRGAPGRTLTVAGIYRSGGILDPVLVTSSVGDDYLRAQSRQPFALFVTAGPGQSRDTLRAQADKLASSNPLVTVQDRHEYVDAATAPVNVVLAVLYGLLALAVAISILGIVNTLALSVVERVREMGMMRAIGTQRAQIRRMITVESVMICVYGALIGLGLGVTYGYLLVGQLADDGLTTRVIPWEQIGAFFAAAVLVGLLAAVWPAFKAARIGPLEAIAEG